MFINLENILNLIFWNCCVNVISKKKNVIILLCNVIILLCKDMWYNWNQVWINIVVFLVMVDGINFIMFLVFCSSKGN